MSKASFSTIIYLTASELTAHQSAGTLPPAGTVIHVVDNSGVFVQAVQSAGVSNPPISGGGGVSSAIATGVRTGTDHVLTYIPALTSALSAGQEITFIPNASYVVGDTIDTKAVQEFENGTLNALESGDFIANGFYKLRYNGTQWIMIGEDTTIPDNAVTTVKIADNAVTLAKMEDMTANSVHVRNNSVAGDPVEMVIPTNTVLGRKAGDIVAETVATAQIADNAITTAKITDLNVTTAKVANDAVTYGKIQNVSATDKVLGRSTAGAGDIEEIPITAFGRSLIDDADAATARTTLGTTDDTLVVKLAGAQAITGIKTFSALPDLSLDASTNNQPIRKSQHDTAMALKANLASPALSGTPTAPTAIAGTNTTQVATTSFVTTADNLKAPIASPTFTGAVTLPADPTSALQPATKQYVDNLVSGLSIKESARVATTVNINITTDLINGDVIDGVTLVTGDRVLVKNQTTASQNGIYVTVASGAGTRTTDFDGTPTGEVKSGAFAMVSEGTVNADSGWTLTTNGTITIGTTALTFVQFTGAGQVTAGTGITKTGNTLSIVNDAITYALLQNVSVTDRLLGRSSAGAGDVEEIPLTAFGRSILDDVDGAAVRETIQAANRNAVKETVRVVITTALPANTRTLNVITASANGALGVRDGVTLIVGDRVLISGEATTINNGIYTVTTLGAVGSTWSMTRATDFDGTPADEVQSGMTVPVSEGTSGADSLWMLITNGTITVNTTALTFSKISQTISQAVTVATTAFPVSTTQGTVNIGTAIETGTTWNGFKVYRRTVRGYFPNNNTDISNVNGVAQSFLIQIGTAGELLLTGGWIDRPGANQHHLLKDLPNNGGHISSIYLGNTNLTREIRIWNTMSGDTTFNGAQFEAFVEYHVGV